MLRQLRYFSTGRRLRSHPILSRLQSHDQDKVAIRHVPSGNEYTYGQLVDEIEKWRSTILDRKSKRVALMGENSFQFVAPFYAAMTLQNTVAIPLCTNHTPAEIEYQLEDSGAETIITPQRFRDKVEQFGSIADILITEEAARTKNTSKDLEPSNSSSYMLYTSGTSGKPKGVVTPLQTYMSQAKALTQVWNINSDTNFLQTLPLHHVHGLLIATTLPLLAGGRVEFLFPFSPAAWVNRLKDESLPPINTYTAVPTVYTRIISHIKSLDQAEADSARHAIQSNLKLAMCGSAALPDPLRKDWDWVTDGKVPLLERYGMTETGITFSQPLDAKKRVAGTVGSPVPSVTARIVDPDNSDKVLYRSDVHSLPTEVSPPGEIQLKGPVVFEKYLNKPEATAETFTSGTEDGEKWFKTGDIAVVNKEGYFQIQGRASMDIIKSGGEKISALEIEREILGLNEVDECSVIGLPNEEWGEQVAVVAALNKKLTLDELKSKLKPVLAGWKIPKQLIIVDKIPRNQMGKVNKKQLVKQYQA